MSVPSLSENSERTTSHGGTAVPSEHGVELRHLSAEPLETECTKVVYLVRGQLDLMKHISLHIHDNASKGLQRECSLYFVPQRSVSCEQILKEEKVHDSLTIGEYPLYMVLMDEDVISFELECAYKECLVDSDTSSLWHIAKAIHKLESSFGLIPNVRAKGKASLRVADILERVQTEEPVNVSDVLPEISTLILLDREVISGFVFHLVLHVNNGSVELDASIMGVQQEGRKVKVPLNSSDKLFKEIRDLNFEVVVQVLRQKATSMKQDYTDITTTRHINLAQHLSTFTSKPSFLGRLDMEHTIVESESYDICFEYIEEMIHKQEPLISVLRLLVLLSVTNSGLPKKHYDYLRTELLHSYGFEHMVTLNNLEKAGLFRKQEMRSNWLTVKRALHLVVEDTDTANPNDTAYVFSGYAPLSIRLIQQAIRSGW
ncbi:hypothetical protein Cgig2_012222 [Carnegiea gigantea]|uniref:Uncharacterized protein n=1 Tax=Carnegiea gigantea TaxID=171969 RepID=A0A9Q1KTF7_9CARY|nr:hypothetical protein Cgig2_012222 [Carnegiea gigantea]